MERPRHHWLLAAVPIALVVLAVVLGLTLVTPPGSEARAAEPRATAGFQTTEELILAVDLPALDKGTRPTLTLELLDRNDKVIATQTPKLPGNEAASLRVAFERPKEKLDHLKVRLTSGKKASLVTIGDVLLTKAHETTVSASNEVYAGSQAAMRCGVSGVKSVSETIPLSADVTVKLYEGKKVHTLFEGKTGESGVADVRYTVPDLPAGDYKVEVFTRSVLGEEKLERNVKVQQQPKILLTTDKPLYQPGQTIHVRALALRAFDLAPAANKDVTLEIEDGKGNKVFKKTLPTSEYGIVHTDFVLADEVNMGEYRIRAINGQHTSEKTVEVKRYVLPKFKSALTSDKTYYLPKETIKGKLQVDYFFGKPVAGGTVEVTASTFDVAFKQFATSKGKTDDKGAFDFEVKLPDYFVGTPLASGNAIVKIEVKVTDTADHTETVTRTYPVSDQAIRVSLIPEAGKLVPGIENRIFAAALYPDGTPAKATVDFYVGNKVQGKPVATVKTNESGLAELKLTPKAENFRTGEWGQVNVELLGGTQQAWRPSNLFDVAVEAKDDKGNKASRVESLTSEPLGENLLLRLDKAIYKGGDSMNVEVLTSAGTPTIYLDVVKAGQVMLTRWLDVKNNAATAKIDLPAHLFGTLEVHAYTVLSGGEIVRDSRVLYVNPADELKIDVKADKGVYQPGEEGTIRFTVTDSKGKPTPAALGVLIVDEAVYALQDMQPGLEKVYFTLQQELMKPKVQANFSPRENLDGLINRPGLKEDDQQIAQVLMTAVKPKPPARWDVNPAEQRRQKARESVALIAERLVNLVLLQKPVLVKDKKTQKWEFATDFLDQLVKNNQLTEQQLTDPTGKRYTAESLSKLEPSFTAEQLGRAVTQVAMQDVAGTVMQYTQQHEKALKKGDKWDLPKTLVADAVKKQNPGLPTKDAWGKEIGFAARGKGEANPYGGAFFAAYNLVSAGPDGEFGTADDVALNPSQDRWTLVVAWWLADDTRAMKQPNLPRRTRQQFHMRWREMDDRADFNQARGMEQFKGGFGGGGGPPVPQRDGGGVPKLAEAAKGKDEGKPTQDQAKGEGGEGAPAARLREYFPETMLWQPAVITDDKGLAVLKVNFADSITTWRLSASGSSRAGKLGGVSAPLRVFQDFFVDLDLPVALTQNDEVTFPVAVYNYLKDAQTVTLDLKKDAAFELLDGEHRREVSLKSGEVTSVKFRIKARKVGSLPLQVDARGSKMSDAIKRVIEVLPDGKPVEQIHNDRLGGTVKHTIHVPDNAIEGASRLFVRVYPGVMSQVMEGAEGMIRLPGG